MLFLSFAGEDKAAAAALAEGLRRAGVEVWCSAVPESIPAGQRWVERIYKALEGCSGYVVLVGHGPVDGWVLPELDYALNRRAQRPDFRVIPALLPGVGPGVLPPELKSIEVLSLPPKFERAGSEAYLDLRRRLDAGTWLPQVDTDARVAPFPGLDAFNESQTRYFFGRSREVNELCFRLGDTSSGHRRWLHIHGPSGCGKSSLARAGLIPAVRRGWIDERSQRWRVAVMRPGAQPVRNLGQAVAGALGKSERDFDRVLGRLQESDDGLANMLREVAGQDREPEPRGFLLLVDQLEEAVTHGGELTRFDGLLTKALLDDIPLYLVTTVRTDFLHRFAQGLPRLAALVNERASTYQLGPVAPDLVPWLIRGPVQVAGLEITDDLVERLRKDAVRLATAHVALSTVEPGSAKAQIEALPLLAHALRTLWDKREDRCLTYEAYTKIERLIGESADKLLGAIEPDRELALELLTQLVRTARGELDTRQTLAHADAVTLLGGGKAGEARLARLSGGGDPAAPQGAPASVRLVSSDGDRVDLISDVLIYAWPTLHERVDRVRLASDLRYELDSVARSWDSGGRLTGGLPSGGQLARFAGVQHPTPLGRELVKAAKADERSWRRQKWGFVLGIALLVWFFAWQWHLISQDASRLNQLRVDRADLGDLVAEELGLRSKSLIPAEGIADWLDRAEDVCSRREAYTSELEALNARSHGPGSHDGSSKTEREDKSLLEAVLQRIAVLDGPETGLIPDMRRRLARAKNAWDQSRTDQWYGAWPGAIERVAASKIYGGLRIRPQIGLSPLGENVATHLEEFAVLGTGTVPIRNPETGVLEPLQAAPGRAAECCPAVVLALLPGREIECSDNDGAKRTLRVDYPFFRLSSIHCG